MRFALVNGRTPCQQSVCVLCGEPIVASSLREVGTQLTYRDHDCYGSPIIAHTLPSFSKIMREHRGE
jgi:hypothetical protein